VLAYTVADDRSDGDGIDASARRELRAICHAADYFGEMGVAAQVDFKRSTGVFRGVVAQTLQKKRSYPGFKAARAESHPLWRDIEARLKHSRLRVLEEDVDLNAARPNVLRSFLHFGQGECPADQYVVFFYGHGYGPVGVFFDADAGEDADTLHLSGLANSVEAIGDSAAVIVFRVCEVNTLETAYQLKDAAKFMIASQSVVPIAGVWPWETFMSGLFQGATASDVAQSIVRQLALFLEEPAHRTPFADVPYTLIDLGAAHAIAKPLKALANALDAGRDQKAFASACSRALEASRVGFPDDPKNPGDPALLDVPTMCDNLGRLARYPAVSGPARALGAVVSRRLVKWHSSRHGLHRGAALFYQPTTRRQIKHSHIYDQDNAAKDGRNYRRLALSQATGWDRIALRPLG
jgi:hypothetical protein